MAYFRSLLFDEIIHSGNMRLIDGTWGSIDVSDKLIIFFNRLNWRTIQRRCKQWIELIKSTIRLLRNLIINLLRLWCFLLILRLLSLQYLHRLRIIIKPVQIRYRHHRILLRISFSLIRSMQLLTHLSLFILRHVINQTRLLKLINILILFLLNDLIDMLIHNSHVCDIQVLIYLDVFMQLFIRFVDARRKKLVKFKLALDRLPLERIWMNLYSINIL